MKERGMGNASRNGSGNALVSGSGNGLGKALGNASQNVLENALGNVSGSPMRGHLMECFGERFACLLIAIHDR